MTAGYEKFFFDAPAMDYSDQTLVQRLLYVADKEDAELLENEKTKEIFLITWERMQEAKTSQAYYDDSWMSWDEIFKAFGANSRILGIVVQEQLEATGEWPEDLIGQEQEVLMYSHELVTVLMKEHWKEHLLLTLQLIPKNASPVRLHNRCKITGRPKGYMRQFGISRIQFREMASKGLIPGVKKASW